MKHHKHKVQQNVKYDIITGKMYEEQGTSSSTSGIPDNSTPTNTTIASTLSHVLPSHSNTYTPSTASSLGNGVVKNDGTPVSIGTANNMPLATDYYQDYQSGYSTYGQIQQYMGNFGYVPSGSGLTHASPYER